MIVFPQDFVGLLVPVAILEGTAGILKTNLDFENKILFWAGLIAETICAGVQSAALIITVSRGIYSRLEIAAASLTVIFVILILIVEAFLVKESVLIIEASAGLTGMLRFVAAVFLGLSGFPILLAKVQRRRTSKLFKSLGAAGPLLSLSVLPVFALVAIWFSYLSEYSADGFRLSKIFTLVTIFSVVGVSISLGAVILTTHGENVSLTFLVFSNISHALIISLPVGFVYLTSPRVYGEANAARI